MNNLLIILSIWAAFYSPEEKATKDHPFYVSITELEVKDDTLQISLRIFTEDLEYALNERVDEKVFLQNAASSPRNFIHIKDYLFEQFKTGNGSGNLRIEWLGHEFEDDVCWIYGQVPIPANQNILFVQNKVLTEIYSDQKNMIHFKANGEITTKIAQKSNPEVRFIRP